MTNLTGIYIPVFKENIESEYDNKIYTLAVLLCNVLLHNMMGACSLDAFARASAYPFVYRVISKIYITFLIISQPIFLEQFW